MTELARVIETLEGTSHANSDAAAAYFHEILQPLVSQYGFEIFGDINPLSDRLENLYVSNLANDGLGIGGNPPYQGMPTIHAHGIVSESPVGFEPFSPQDVDWMLSTPSNTHYVSDPTGVYRFNGLRKPPTRISP
jgi:hypothetical protein